MYLIESAAGGVSLQSGVVIVIVVGGSLNAAKTMNIE